MSPPSHAPALIVLVASTGGPRVLRSILPALTRDLLTPILIVQHMAPSFLQPWTERLSAAVRRPVELARDGAPVVPRQIAVAPPEVHLEVERDGCRLRTRLVDDTPPYMGCMPSGTVLLRSAARAVGGRVVAAVFTGMGNDGAAGAEAVAEAGGQVLLQNEATSVVWGMPRAAAELVPSAPALSPSEIVEGIRAVAWLAAPPQPAALG